MTPDSERPDLDEATRLAEESTRQAAKDYAAARTRSAYNNRLARWLRTLREDNGFHELFEVAMRGRSDG